MGVAFERDGNVQAVFGEAIKLEHHTIIPVAVVAGGGGAGGTQGEQSVSAGGMGLGLNVRPVGFIYESGDQVLFTPIHLDGRNRPLWSEAAFGVRRAIDLASAVITQFMQRKTKRAPATVIHAVPGESPDEVNSPS
jgi:uncharacterized spore protein YtfJ